MGSCMEPKKLFSEAECGMNAGEQWLRREEGGQSEKTTLQLARIKKCLHGPGEMAQQLELWLLFQRS